MDYWQWRLKSDWLDLKLAAFGDEGDMVATPAEITKATEIANKVKSLLDKTSKANELAQPVIASYDKTLTAFIAHVTNLSKQDAALQAALAAMGNAQPALEAAFGDNEDKGQAGSVSAPDKAISVNPAENAGLHAVKPGGPNAA